MASNIKQLTDGSGDKVYPVTIGEAVSMNKNNTTMSLESFLMAKIGFYTKEPTASDGDDGDIWFCD